MCIITKKKCPEKTQEWIEMTEDGEISGTGGLISPQGDLQFTSTEVAASAPETITFMKEKEIMMWI